jgi:predicted transcriptional regulator
MSKKGRGKQNTNISKEALTEQIITTLTKNPEQGFNYKQIAKSMNVTDSYERQMISDILKDLTKQGAVQEWVMDLYQLKNLRMMYLYQPII